MLSEDAQRIAESVLSGDYGGFFADEMDEPEYVSYGGSASNIIEMIKKHKTMLMLLGVGVVILGGAAVYMQRKKKMQQ